MKYSPFAQPIILSLQWIWNPCTVYKCCIQYASISLSCPCGHWPFKSYLRHFYYFQMIWLEGHIGECHYEPWMKLIGFNGWLIRANLIKSTEHWCNPPSPQSSWIQWLTQWVTSQICMSKLTITGPDNGLSPACHWLAPSYYPNQCWNIVNSNLRNTFQWNLKWISYFFIQEITLKNVVDKMASILSQPQCLNLNWLNCFDEMQICICMMFNISTLKWGKWLKFFFLGVKHLLM